MNENWIHLSRDLHGIPRAHPARLHASQRASATVHWRTRWHGGCGASCSAARYSSYLMRGDRTRTTGLSAAFLFLGAYLTCYRFMYYDVLLAAMVMALLFAEPTPLPSHARLRRFARRLQPAGTQQPRTRHATYFVEAFQARMLGYVNSFPLTIVMMLFVLENSLSGLHLEATVGIGYYASPATDGSTNP